MRLRLDEIAKELNKKGFTSLDIDTPKFDSKVLEILVDLGFFENLQDEMTLIEEENEPKNLGEYLEKIGEI
jgi:hypothetical protein